MNEPEKKIQDRLVAHIVSLSDVLGRPVVEQEGWLPDYVVSDWGDKISRINIMGTVVDRDERQIILDDGTATIPLRVFEPIHRFGDIVVGDVVSCIGKLRSYNSEQYVLAEIVSKVDMKFLQVRARQLSLFSNYRGAMKRKNQDEALNALESSEETVVAPKNGILDYIDGNDKGDGISINSLAGLFEDAQKQIDMLLMNGDVYEIKPGVLKVLK